MPTNYNNFSKANHVFRETYLSFQAIAEYAGYYKYFSNFSNMKTNFAITFKPENLFTLFENIYT